MFSTNLQIMYKKLNPHGHGLPDLNNSPIVIKLTLKPQRRYALHLHVS